MVDIPGYIKSHPLQTAGIGVVAALAIYLVLSSGNSSGGSTSAGGPSDAEVQAGLQMSAIQAQSQAQSAQINGAISLAAAKSAGDFALAQLTATTSTAQQVNQLNYQTGHDADSFDLGKLTIGAQEAVNLAGINASVTNNQIIQNAAVDINKENNITNQITASYIAQTQSIISGNQADVAIHQTDATVAIAKIVANAQTTGGWQGLIGRIVAPGFG